MQHDSNIDDVTWPEEIDIIINRVGPMVGPRMLGLRKSWKVNRVEPGPKPGTSAGHWAMMPKNPKSKDVERPAILPTSKPAAKRAKKLMKGARWTMLTESEIRRSQNYPGYPDEYPKEWESGEYPVYGYPYDY